MGLSSSEEKVCIVVFVDWALCLTVLDLRDGLRCEWAGGDVDQGHRIRGMYYLHRHMRMLSISRALTPHVIC
jgi:hypothetical protein